MSKRELSVFTISATYIGTVVGAGFASGQEVLQFFGYHGMKGFIGLIIATIMFVVYGYIILILGHNLNASSYHKVIMETSGLMLGKIVDYIVMFFLFGALTAMLAGSGAIFKEQFGLSTNVGSVVMVILSIATVLTGIAGVISAISYVVPLLLVGVFTVGILAIFHAPEIAAISEIYMPVKAAVRNFILSGVIYASYNLVMSVPVLAPLGGQVHTKSRLKYGALLGGIGLGIGASIIFLAILLNMPAASYFQIPMIYIAGKFSYLLKFLYSFILIAEIYTTAVGNLYGFVARLTETGTYKYKIVTILTGAIALIASKFGFSKLIHYLYPITGGAGIIMLIGLTYGIMRKKY
ncbi:Uncharacterized membrane protein YkvI [Caldanaerobius fijiensis DSM 17918]|uniref:Uncharacterized membrane protein YkvI n=1 Tax=Caldanaerobius fijiensis DSM 17918 TaxID=1121256 RepID=A0A1M4Y886_9THEO|nr:hypothetical protein [Caldanaerobius fijiensis]SHF01898.1 Uncharacterized membrane protein YkvI [Caldanaerobius fijiensis DSM 17918]